MTRQLVEVEGIVFKRKKFKEADILAKILTDQYGIITLEIKGALKAKSRLGGATLNFSYGNYVINTNFRGISTLRTFKQVKQFDEIYLDLLKNSYASYLLDLVDHAFLEYQSIGEYYPLIMTALKKINDGFDVEIITQLVQLKMLKAFGVEPQMRKCIICGKEKGVFDYSIELGGIICNDHFNENISRMHLQSKTVSLLRTLMLINIDQISNINISKQLKLDSKKVIDRVYASYLELNLKTKKFLDELVLL
ncbi:DNA repair protein RecO (recombination protein O) [Lactobacillus colini]|uniref:DNA repair protein RecO n=1 Tax=Lactobacillus colini TaxID=1819254 RepID=A0ABS4MBM8_9LACO|nr:DNA repair protein RecO [Lactobacillus colini]MBP2057056.1 DNA repair protein RecO (recombination protein O) [Lactobacillus colini]